MNHSDHKLLLKKGIISRGGIWADLGSGRGAFTLALADLAGSTAVIYSVDKNRQALREQARQFETRFPDVKVDFRVQNFAKRLDLPPLDGIVMANSLHFVRRKEKLLEKIIANLKPGGRFLLVEYNTDRGNVWVPHPLSYATWKRLAAQAGFVETQKLEAYPSRFLGEIYSAVSIRE